MGYLSKENINILSDYIIEYDKILLLPFPFEGNLCQNNTIVISLYILNNFLIYLIW